MIIYKHIILLHRLRSFFVLPVYIFQTYSIQWPHGRCSDQTWERSTFILKPYGKDLFLSNCGFPSRTDRTWRLTWSLLSCVTWFLVVRVHENVELIRALAPEVWAVGSVHDGQGGLKSQLKTRPGHYWLQKWIMACEDFSVSWKLVRLNPNIGISKWDMFSTLVTNHLQGLGLGSSKKQLAHRMRGVLSNLSCQLWIIVLLCPWKLLNPKSRHFFVGGNRTKGHFKVLQCRHVAAKSCVSGSIACLPELPSMGATATSTTWPCGTERLQKRIASPAPCDFIRGVAKTLGIREGEITNAAVWCNSRKLGCDLEIEHFVGNRCCVHLGPRRAIKGYIG